MDISTYMIAFCSTRPGGSLTISELGLGLDEGCAPRESGSWWLLCFLLLRTPNLGKWWRGARTTAVLIGSMSAGWVRVAKGIWVASSPGIRLSLFRVRFSWSDFAWWLVAPLLGPWGNGEMKMTSFTNIHRHALICKHIIHHSQTYRQRVTEFTSELLRMLF